MSYDWQRVIEMGLNRKCCCLIARVSGVWYLSLIHHTYWSSESESNGKRERGMGEGGNSLSLSLTGLSVLVRGVFVCHSSVYTHRSSAEIYDCLFTFKPQQQPAERRIDFAWLCVSVHVHECGWVGVRRSRKLCILVWKELWCERKGTKRRIFNTFLQFLSI